MKLSILKVSKKTTLAILGITLLSFSTPLSIIVNKALAETHSNTRKQNKNNSSKANTKTNDNHLPDGDYTRSCDGFVPDYDVETSCGPATDLGDE